MIHAGGSGTSVMHRTQETAALPLHAPATHRGSRLSVSMVVTTRVTILVVAIIKESRWGVLILKLSQYEKFFLRDSVVIQVLLFGLRRFRPFDGWCF